MIRLRFKTLPPRTPSHLCTRLLKYEIAQAELNQSRVRFVKKKQKQKKHGFFNLDEKDIERF